MEEIWKDVVGYEGTYQVSNLGRVRSLDRWIISRNGVRRFFKGIVMKPQTDKDGYSVVNFHTTKGSHLLKIHRLVASAFIPNKDNKPCIDHIDGVRNNNRVDNLRWCTYVENNNYERTKERNREAVRRSYINNPDLRKLRGETWGRSGMKEIEVYIGDKFIGKYECLTDFCREHHFTQSNVWSAVKKREKYHEYTIRYTGK